MVWVRACLFRMQGKYFVDSFLRLAGGGKNAVGQLRGGHPGKCLLHERKGACHMRRGHGCAGHLYGAVAASRFNAHDVGSGRGDGPQRSKESAVGGFDGAAVAVNESFFKEVV